MVVEIMETARSENPSIALGGSGSRTTSRWVLGTIFSLSLLRLFGAATFPSFERSAVVVTGTVLSMEQVRVNEREFSSTSRDPWRTMLLDEIWRAEITVEAIAKQDEPLPKKIFIYYEQPYRGPLGGTFRACPPYPRLYEGERAQFFCLRRKEGGTNVLFVPEGGWVIDTDLAGADSSNPQKNAQRAIAKLSALHDAARRDEPEAQYRLAGRYWIGNGVEKDIAVALNWYEMAARHGHKEAAYNLATIYEHGLGVTRNAAVAIAWFCHASAGEPSPDLETAAAAAHSDAALTIVPGAPNSATIQWSSQPRTNFVLQSTESLVPPRWIVAPSGPTNPITIITTNSARFYRLVPP
jgi:hypothetical protein